MLTINLTDEDRARLLEIQQEISEIKDRCGVEQIEVESVPTHGYVVFTVDGQFVAWITATHRNPPPASLRQVPVDYPLLTEDRDDG